MKTNQPNQNFKEQMNKASTYGDVIRLCESLTEKEVKKHIRCLTFIKNNYSLTMRDEATLGILLSILKHKAWNRPQEIVVNTEVRE